MSTVLAPTSSESQDSHSVDIGQQLQAETTAVRLHIRWPGVRKTLSQQHKQQAANTFAADSDSVSVSKNLIDTSHPAFRAATAVRSSAVKYWKSSTLPYIEPGVRLLRREDVDSFEVYMTTVKGELAEAVTELGRHYDDLVQQAQQRLGNLFDRSDLQTT